MAPLGDQREETYPHTALCLTWQIMGDPVVDRLSPFAWATLMQTPSTPRCLDLLGARRLTDTNAARSRPRSPPNSARAMLARPNDASVGDVRPFEKGLQERLHGVRSWRTSPHAPDNAAKDKDPQLAADIAEIVEPHITPIPNSSRRVATPTYRPPRSVTACSRRVSEADLARRADDAGHSQSDELPAQATPEGQTAEETRATDAIFANVQAVRSSPGTSQYVGDLDGHQGEGGLGDYVRGEKTRTNAAGEVARDGTTTHRRRRNWSPSAS